MTINYIGPSALRGVFESEYLRISGDYERNNPKILVSALRPIDIDGRPGNFLKLLTGSKNFRSQEEFNGFVNSRVKRLQELEPRADDAKGVYKQFKRVLGIASYIIEQPTYARGARAIYIPTEDFIYFDALFTSMFLIHGASNYPILEAANMPGILRHELVHFNLGTCYSQAERRRYRKEANYFINQGRRGRAASAEGRGAFDRWMEEEGGIEFFEKLKKAQGGTEPELYPKEVMRLLGLEMAVLIREGKLAINVANEALSHAYESDRPGFEFWLREIRFGERERALALYQTLEKRINSQGRLRTLKATKQAINVAYITNRNVLDII